jgi:hypothetical protein
VDRFAEIGGGVEAIHGVDTEPAQRLGLPAADAAVDPRVAGEGGVAAKGEVGQGLPGEIGRRDALADIAPSPPNWCPVAGSSPTVAHQSRGTPMTPHQA